MKPLVRWTIGFDKEDSYKILKLSISNFYKLYGDTFDYAVCYNKCNVEKIKMDIDLPWRVYSDKELQDEYMRLKRKLRDSLGSSFECIPYSAIGCKCTNYFFQYERFYKRNFTTQGTASNIHTKHTYTHT